MQAKKGQLSPHYSCWFAYWQKNAFVSITVTSAFANCIGNDNFFVILTAVISTLHTAVLCRVPDTGNSTQGLTQSTVAGNWQRQSGNKGFG